MSTEKHENEVGYSSHVFSIFFEILVVICKTEKS